MWTGTVGHDVSPSTAATSGSGWLAHWAFTDRDGGTSAAPFDSLNLANHVGDDEASVGENRQRLLDTLGSSVDRLVFMQAEHGDIVKYVTRADQAVAESTLSVMPSCDGLVTDEASIAIAALAADCVPIVLADSEHGVVGVVHCGWRGVVSGVVMAALAQMRDRGADPMSTEAVVGPAICGFCYPVSADRASEVVRALSPGSRGRAVWTDQGSQWHVDVRQAVVAQLESNDVSSQLVGGCTFTDDGLFSYRRDSTTGRQGAAVFLETC